MSLNRPKKLVAELESLEFAGDLFGQRFLAWSAAIGDLLDTPRALKFTLNSVAKAWERTHGEVDIDELLILTALRHRAGPVYSFLVRRALDLRLLAKQSSGADDLRKREHEQQLEELRIEWRDAIGRADANRHAIEILVGDLFSASPTITGRTLWRHSNRLQSVASSRGEIYMERISAGDVPRNVIRDQEVLRLLDALSRGEKIESFAERFLSSRGFGELAIFFDQALRQRRGTQHVPSPARLRAATLMLQQESIRAGLELLYRGSAHHLVLQWISVAVAGPEYNAWAKEEIISRIPNDLYRATELYFDLFRDNHIPLDIQSQVRNEVLEKSRQEFSQMTPQDFATRFPGHFPYTLAHLVRLDSKGGDSNVLRTQLDDWRWLAPLLLSALRERPDILVPQALPLFGTFGPQPGPFEIYRFDHAAIDKFFGANSRTFYEAIAQPVTPQPALDHNFKLLLPLAAKAAKKTMDDISFWQLMKEPAEPTDLGGEDN
jgi:hypothetical protein